MTVTKHTIATRFLHMGVALLVLWQLGASLVMQGPEGTQTGDLLFSAHNYVGLATLGLLLLFWLNVAVRRQGSPSAALFPWFLAERRADVWSDIRRHAASMKKLRFPPHEDSSALASAIHGLGLLLMTLMAATGATWWVTQPSATAGVFREAHALLANLAWVYLIAHGGLAVLHHLRREASLANMWSLRRPN
ncbi:MAG: cytochrome b/b6 domain-containing protein [Hyphomonadaceae bacterium]|nr:cytochrome b/b6 domain-containing protein [Hyphomonadaceae bacterium]